MEQFIYGTALGNLINTHAEYKGHKVTLDDDFSTEEAYNAYQGFLHPQPNGDVDYGPLPSWAPTYAELQAEAERILAAIPWDNLRRERDKRIAETDWWASSDRTMTAEQTAYRQALRDLPDNTTDPENPVWPTKP